MSTINTIHSDISRVPSESTSSPKKTGLAPVFPTEVVHGVAKQPKPQERRLRKERRKQSLKVTKDRRQIMQRRQSAMANNKSVTRLSSRRGKFIDVEV